MNPISTETLAKLKTFDTPTICNVIELFDIRPRNTGFMDGRIQACFPEMAPVVGFAATATFRSAAPPPPGMDVYDTIEEQVARFAELSGPAVVVFKNRPQNEYARWRYFFLATCALSTSIWRALSFRASCSLPASGPNSRSVSRMTISAAT